MSKYDLFKHCQLLSIEENIENDEIQKLPEKEKENFKKALEWKKRNSTQKIKDRALKDK